MEEYILSRNFNFKVSNSQGIIGPILFFFIVLSIIYTIVTKTPNYPMHVLITIFVIVPSVIVFLWIKLFSIKVNNWTITVRKGNGSQYSLDVSDIINIEWRKIDTDFLHTEKIIIRTLSNRFSVDSAMIGFNRMAEYITNNVSVDKIHIIEKDRRSNKE